MRSLIDAQLPPALARYIAATGHHAEHVSDLGMGSAMDSRIWDKALEMDAILMTKDEDFIVRAALTPIRPTIIESIPLEPHSTRGPTRMISGFDAVPAQLRGACTCSDDSGDSRRP